MVSGCLWQVGEGGEGDAESAEVELGEDAFVRLAAAAATASFSPTNGVLEEWARGLADPLTHALAHALPVHKVCAIGKGSQGNKGGGRVTGAGRVLVGGLGR